MKYTDEEIIKKFSNIDYDKEGYKQQAIFTKVSQNVAARRTNSMKKYKIIAVAAAIVLIAVPAILLVSKTSYKDLITQEAKPISTKEQQQIKPVPTKEQPQVKTASLPKETAKQDIAASVYSSTDSLALSDMSTESLSFASYDGVATTWSASKSRSVGRAGAYMAKTASVRWSEPEMQLSKDTKAYNENGFKKALVEPLSTFSADVDTASYNMLKEQINRGWPIQKEGVRTEALINNFAYDYPAPTGSDPISINIEYATAPWNAKTQLVKIGVKAKEIDRSKLPQSNLVFLIDISGSMNSSNRLPLVKQAFKMLLNQLDKDDIVSIVTYASGTDVKLDGVKVKNKEKIIEAIDSLQAGGATSGEEGLKLAYKVAKENFIRKGNNRIIIASDGDFNVGSSRTEDFEKQVSEAKESGVFISALGFGMGNYRDNMMETIADKGNGNYAYINDLKAAQKALVREFGGTMFTVAKDVKFQVEFNPAVVEEYRLIGYEKRLLNNEDFNDDTKDAGEVGSGHTVTVLYEIRPVGSGEKMDIDPLKYGKTEFTNKDEVLTVKMRYKDPAGDKSKLISKTLKKEDLKTFINASNDFRFASAAAAFGQLLRDSQYLNGLTAKEIADIASKAKGEDDSGDRAEFVQLIRTYNDSKN
ncbi:MAG: VWA domain-containing protein [Elusimicrobiaceae bacterium]|nr:VWA domain-containing protein [Elusimicrobiaceae bacterium]